MVGGLIEPFRNHGKVWCREAEEVDEHDFPSAAECLAVPFGVYDVTRNVGCVTVGGRGTCAAGTRPREGDASAWNGRGEPGRGR
jgi:hypothetical protein